MSDHPFSVNAKYVSGTGSEILLSVRAHTVEEFEKHLSEAHRLFPEAGFLPGTQPTPAPAPQARPTPAPAKASRPTPNGKTNGAPNCPEHGPMTPSKWGGWYCPQKDETNEYCQNKVKAG